MISVPPKREVVINGGAGISGWEGVSPLQLTERLAEMRRRYPDLAVAVRADEQAKQRDVLPVYGAINKAGVTNMAGWTAKRQDSIDDHVFARNHYRENLANVGVRKLRSDAGYHRRRWLCNLGRNADGRQ